MQFDGNLVLYKFGHVLWHSGSYGKGPGPYRLIMQTDGNLVIYNGHNQPIWATMTNGQGSGPHRLKIQRDGNLVLYASSGATWASQTYGN
jgi:hypothetical protein